MASSDKSLADIEFNKTRRPQGGGKAMSDYEADAAAVRAKTEKLRALRLARDAAAPPPPVQAKRAGRKAKSGSGSSTSGSSASLSDWLKDREDSGHKN